MTLETEIQKLFETNINQNADALPRTSDADIVFTGAPYIMWKQFQLDNNSKTYLEGTIMPKHVFRTGIKPTPYQKSFELVTGTESRLVDFTGANKQFSFSAISLVYDKSNQHRSIYDNYNTDLASTKIKSITFKNTCNTYSTFNSMKFNTNYLHYKLLLYNQFVASYCKGCSIPP